MKQNQCSAKMTNEAGINVNAIINNLFKEFTCSICLQLFKNPVTVSLCKHTYCLDCLKEWKVISDGKTFKCPLCKNVTTNRSYYPNEKYASAVRFLLELGTFMESKRNKDNASNSSSVLLSQYEYRNTLLQKYLNECVKYKSEYENDGPENIHSNSQIITLSNTSNKENNNNNAKSESNDLLITESEENEFILNICSTAENINIINKLENIFIEDLEKETNTKKDPKQNDKTSSSTKKKKNDTSVDRTDSAKKTDWSRLKQTNRDINKKAGKYKPLKVNETKAKNENSVKKRNTRSSKNQTALGDFDEYVREKNDTNKNTIDNEPIVINTNSEKSAEIIENDDDDIFLRSTQILSLDNLNTEVSIIKLGNKRKTLNSTLTKEEETGIKKQKTPDKNENVIVISADIHHSNDSIVDVPIKSLNKSSSADIIENTAENVKITKPSNKKSASIKDPTLLNLSNEFKESLKTVSELKSSVLQSLEQNLKESDQILSEYSNLIYNSDSLFSSDSPGKFSRKDGPNKTKLLHNVFSAPTLEVTSKESITFYNTAIPCLEKIKGYYQQLKALSDQLTEQSTVSIENSPLGNKNKMFADTEIQTDILKCPTCTFTFNLKSATNTSTPQKRSGSNESNILREESIKSKTPKRESQTDFPKKESSKSNTTKANTSKTNTSKEESQSDFPKKESSKLNITKTNTSKEENQSDIPKKELSKANTPKSESQSDNPKKKSPKSNTSTPKNESSKLNTSKTESQSSIPRKESDSNKDKTDIPSKGSESNSEDFNAFLEDIKKNISKNPPSDSLPKILEEDDTKKKRFKRIRTPTDSDSEESSETSKKSKNNSYQSKLLYRDSIDVCFHSTTSQMYSNIEPPNKSKNFENNTTILDPATKNSKSSEDTLMYLEQQYHNPILNNNTSETGVLEKNTNLDNLLSGIDVSAFENDFTVTNKNNEAPESNQLNQKTDLSASLFTETQVNKLNSSIAKPDKINESPKNPANNDIVETDSVVEDSYESDEIFEDDVVDTTPQKTVPPKRINETAANKNTSQQLNCSASNSQLELLKLQNQNQLKLNTTSMTPDFLPLSNLDLNCGFFDNSKFISKNTQSQQPNQNNIVDQVQNNLKPILLAQNDDLPLQLVKQDNYVPNKNKLENKQPQHQSSILSYFNAHPQSTPTSRVTNQQPATSNSDVDDRCESPVLHARPSSTTAVAATVVFCTSRLNKREIAEVANYAPRLNAKYNKVFDENVTHLIVSVDENNRVVDQTLKYLLAIAHGIWIVSHSWFKNSVVQNRLLPEEYYEVLDMSGVPGPRMSRLRRRESPIFEDFVFIIVEPLVTVTKTELEDVIVNLGGEIKKSLIDFEKYPGKHYLILSEGKYCENDAEYEKLKDDYGIMSVDIEWLSESVGRYKLISIRGYMLCSDDNIEKYGYPPELIAPIPESQIQTLSHDDV